MTTLFNKEDHSLEFQNPSEQSFSGAVRQNLEIIEARIAVGVRLKAIHNFFLAAGYTVNLDTFKAVLYRARRERDGLKLRVTTKARPQTPLALETPAQEPVDVKPVAPAVPRDYFARTSIFSKHKG